MEGNFHNSAYKTLLRYNGALLETLKSKYDRSITFQTLGIAHIGAIGLILISPYGLRYENIRRARCGFGYGYSSMKGAVGIRFAIANTNSEVTILAAHLPAGEGHAHYQQRNHCLHTMYRALDFGDGYGLLKPQCHSFVMGDLNYRTTENHSRESPQFKRLSLLQNQLVYTPELARELVSNYDELTVGRANGDMFLGFSEAPIEFAPTYKFHLNTAIYNDKRTPSWCDRILFQSTYVAAPRIISYNSLATQLHLDHQPVYLIVSVSMDAPKPIILPHGYLQVLDECTMNELFTGPTEIYVKPTVYDLIVQNLVRPISDTVIGYSIWLATTHKGRFAILAIVLVAWFWVLK